jgi:hypothetical protein
MQSVGGSDVTALEGAVEAALEHHPSAGVSLTRKGTGLGGQFGWGGTPLQRYQGRPKAGSGGTETHRRGQGQKPA